MVRLRVRVGLDLHTLRGLRPSTTWPSLQKTRRGQRLLHSCLNLGLRSTVVLAAPGTVQLAGGLWKAVQAGPGTPFRGRGRDSTPSCFSNGAPPSPRGN